MTTKQVKRTAHALIIGIDRYADPKAPNLLGARNDAIAFYKLCRRDLRIPAANITVAASPPLTAEELGLGADKATLTDATGETLRGAIKALSSKVTGSTEVGLMTYSGHGVVVDAPRSGTEEAAGLSLAMCPSDTSNGPDGSVIGAIDYVELHQLIGDKARENLTVILDTCNNGVDDRVSQRHFLGRRERDEKAKSAARALLKAHPEPISCRVLVSVDYDQVAREIETPSGWRGAFSHCLCLVLQRWRLMSMNGVHHYEVNHEELLYRVRLILSSLSVDQRPQLLGSDTVAHLPVFKPGLHSLPGDTSREPNRKLPGSQFPVDTGITLCGFQQNTGDRFNSVFYFLAWNSSFDGDTLSYRGFQVVLPDDGRSECWFQNNHNLLDTALGTTYRWFCSNLAVATVEEFLNDAWPQAMVIRAHEQTPIGVGNVLVQTFNSEAPSDSATFFGYQDGSEQQWYFAVDGTSLAWGIVVASNDWPFVGEFSDDFTGQFDMTLLPSAPTVPDGSTISWYVYAPPA